MKRYLTELQKVQGYIWSIFDEGFVTFYNYMEFLVATYAEEDNKVAEKNKEANKKEEEIKEQQQQQNKQEKNKTKNKKKFFNKKKKK
jgi:hypothetical protein